MAAQTLLPGVLLTELLHGLGAAAVNGALRVSGVTLDSRKVQPGDLFLALAGSRSHGARHIDDAVARGAAVVALEPQEAETLGAVAVPLIRIPNLRAQAGVIAARFYGQPSQGLTVIGVTGTNGKTSVSHFIAQALTADAPCGIIGTLGCGLYGALHSRGHTTPDAVTLQAELAAQQAAGAKAVAMEVSSHGLDQQRVAGVAFDVAVFTNLSHEHLDYHGNMEAYALAKRRLFTQPGLRTAVLNLDDAVGRRWYGELAGKVERIGFTLDVALAGEGVLVGCDLALSDSGLAFTVSGSWGEGRIESGLFGRFNAANLLAALGALLASGMAFTTAISRLNTVRTVPGRMERFAAPGQPTVVVDYAHTPDALEKVLQALREHCRGNLWCVFGCGGDRDRAKRPLMGQLAESMADHVVITDDNPRSENPWDIIENIQHGMKEPDAVYVLRDRARAIAHAIDMAQENDMVLVAGKGHETEQLVAGKVLPFSDRAEVAQLLGVRCDG